MAARRRACFVAQPAMARGPLPRMDGMGTDGGDACGMGPGRARPGQPRVRPRPANGLPTICNRQVGDSRILRTPLSASTTLAAPMVFPTRSCCWPAHRNRASAASSRRQLWRRKHGTAVASDLWAKPDGVLGMQAQPWHGRREGRTCRVSTCWQISLVLSCSANSIWPCGSMAERLTTIG